MRLGVAAPGRAGGKGTPIYWFGPSAQLKAFVDRWYGRYGGFTQLIPDFVGRRIILTMPLEVPNPAGARHTVAMLTDTLTWLKAEVFATVLAPGVNEKGAVREHPDMLEAARRAGREAVEA